MMDSNEHRAANKAFINKIVQNNGLLEAMKSNEKTTTYRRRTSQLDYIMCSPNLLPFIRYIQLQEFGTIFTSDHKSYIIDIALVDWLKCGKDKVPSLGMRVITSLSKTKIAKYKAKIVEDIRQSNITQQLQQMDAYLHCDTSPNNIQNILNQVDTEFTKIRISAEKELSTSHMQTPWSPVIDQAYYTHQYWITREKQLTSGLNYSPDLDTIRAKLKHNIVDNISTRNEIRQKIKEAKEILTQLRKNSDVHRRDHLQQALKKAEMEHNDNATREIKQLIRTEDSRCRYRKISFYFKTWLNSNLTRLSIPNQQG